MDEKIKYESVKKAADEVFKGTVVIGQGDLNLWIETIRAITGKEVAEVKHGWWLQNGMCSECLVIPDTSHKGYCPNCGAKMDGKRKDGEQAW